jgi:hypothetical protein
MNCWNTRQKEADGDYSPTVQMVNTIAYGQYARLKWDVRGVPAGNTCTASSSAGAPVWTGSKALSGVADLGQMTGGSFVYRLTCSYASTTNYDEITLNIPPYVELTGSIPSFTAVTATNSQTVNINSVANPAPLNAGVTLSGYTKGADRCTITSSPAGYVPSPTSYTTAVTSTRIGVFSNKISTGINGTTSFTLACSRTISGVTRSSFATIRVFASTGNCAFKGNNDIQAMTFCKNSLVTLNGGDNIQLKGSFVASNFSIDSDSDNVRFMYDFDTRDKTPPGFNYLNIPSPKEVGNSQ